MPALRLHLLNSPLTFYLPLLQCLFKAGLHPEASKACLRVDGDQYAQRLLLLQASVKYEGG